MSSSDAVREFNRQFNERTGASWESYASHRRRLTDLLLESKPAGAASLCVLGAGNCNDLELGELAGAYEEIRLADIDGHALLRGVARQSPANPQRLSLLGDCDVTGVAGQLAAFRPDSPASDADIAQCLEALAGSSAAEKIRAGRSAAFDVVASTCLLSQLVEAVRRTLGESHPRLVDLVLAIRRQHLRLLTRLAAPGGVMLLVTDFVSSETAPELLSDGEVDLVRLASRLLQSGNFFTGANPLAIRREWSADPLVASRLALVELLAPWKWRLEHRTFLVAAVRARANSAGIAGHECETPGE